ncbi:hypothetical protein [Microbispora sp. H10830]|uniref:hypothetical protein n=1 Tax=Microbispora sp. H10830 TaxID=2729109 RepID=UPI001C719EFA|nr:hypothetical protein [Microbispora sp. H10830]
MEQFEGDRGDRGRESELPDVGVRPSRQPVQQEVRIVEEVSDHGWASPERRLAEPVSDHLPLRHARHRPSPRHRPDRARQPSARLVDDLHVRVVNATAGELIRELITDPTRDYQPQYTKKPPNP